MINEQLSLKTKTLFNTTREFSLYSEQEQTIEYDLQAKLLTIFNDFTATVMKNMIGSFVNKLIDNVPTTVVTPPSELQDLLVKNIFATIFYDFIDKMDRCPETNDLFVQIITEYDMNHPGLKFVTDGSDCFNYVVKSDTVNIMKTFFNIINDDEWFMNFFQEYINEIINMERYTETLDILKYIRWENVIMDYVEEMIIQNIEK